MKPVTFLKNVAREMKKVSWPGREELFRYTLTVVATVAFIAIFFTIVDMGITQILNLLFD
ncbi:protein translocase subunit secE/sec61 gamma [Amphibacillus marinus]|uniref:Protein translocase subunit SecE n=1 Tax=Amphibacillus marinus TaxID=872970 RepID=A0A1H8SEB1_9BACI|nr:preprotein translocase subunit SecE [Amphibacillus marinus]SEO76885.1 protein translocase subunit secE/sec61 gamma [Amphibacillus marinus]